MLTLKMEKNRFLASFLLCETFTSQSNYQLKCIQPEINARRSRHHETRQEIHNLFIYNPEAKDTLSQR